MFSKTDLELMQLVDNQRLAQANYYIKLPEVGAPIKSGFLIFLELVFENNASLILTSDAESESISVTTAKNLVEVATEFHQKNGAPLIHSVDALQSPIWAAALSRPLAGIRFSRLPDDRLANDSLVLDFETIKIIIFIGDKKGLEIAQFDEKKPVSR